MQNSAHEKDPFNNIDNEYDSLKLDLSHSIKNPFDEGQDDDNESKHKDSFDSRFLESEKSNNKNSIPVAEISVEEAKDLNRSKSISSQRKKWDLSNNSRKIQKQKSKKRNSDETLDDESDKDSSFMSDFGELAEFQKKPSNNAKAGKKQSLDKQLSNRVSLLVLTFI